MPEYDGIRATKALLERTRAQSAEMSLRVTVARVPFCASPFWSVPSTRPLPEAQRLPRGGFVMRLMPPSDVAGCTASRNRQFVLMTMTPLAPREP